MCGIILLKTFRDYVPMMFCILSEVCSVCSFQWPGWDVIARRNSGNTAVSLAAVPSLPHFFQYPAMEISMKISQKQGYERSNVYLITPGYLRLGMS